MTTTNSQQNLTITLNEGEIITVDRKTYLKYREDIASIAGKQKRYLAKLEKLNTESIKLDLEFEELQDKKIADLTVDENAKLDTIQEKAIKIKNKLKAFEKQLDKFDNSTTSFLNNFRISMGLAPKY